jgi:hypothetical protein
MGFKDKIIKYALEKTNNNFDEALDNLLICKETLNNDTYKLQSNKQYTDVAP